MKTFGKLPSSPDIRAMNEAQWLFCYSNIIKDEQEKEELWRSRAKYLGLFINPDAVKSLAKFEEEQKNGSSNSSTYTANNKKNDSVYVNDDFEKELQEAMKDDFVELPDSNDVRGNPNMSSDEFLNACIQNKQQLEENDNDEDLDIIEINE